MKRLTIMVCAPIGVSAYALAAPALKVENIKQIVCESTVSYDEDSPNEKTAARGVKMFKPGSRKDVQRRPGAFLLAEVYPENSTHIGLRRLFFVADWDRSRNRGYNS